jgi:trans-aconitate methyltransferase
MALHLSEKLNPELVKQDEVYLNVRAAEGRLYPDEMVLQLPYLAHDHPHAAEWRIRAETFRRLLPVIGNKPRRILEVGCGNGWLCHRLAEHGHGVSGIDINLTELRQATSLFPECSFHYGNILEWKQERFDIILFAASIQYFPDIHTLFHHIRAELLKPSGFILVADSPVYPLEEVSMAATRSSSYYRQRGFPEMRDYYHHHSLQTFLDEGAYSPEKVSIFEKILIGLKLFRRPFRIYRFD